MCFGIIGKDGGVYNFEYLMQVLVLRFALATYFFENAFDFIKGTP